MIKATDISLGVRVSSKIKQSLDKYCHRTGVSRKHFVEQAIKEKLVEIMEDEQDSYLAQQRLNEPSFVSEKQIEAYFSKRLKEK